MLLQGQVGPTQSADGSLPSARQGKTGELMVSQLHGRFYEQASRGSLFSAGSSTTALSANTISLTATTTPIVGVYNPANSGVNLVILQAYLQAFINTFTTPVSAGAWVWAASTGNFAITTGAVPFSRGILSAVGSNARAKAFNGGVALTGLTNNLAIFECADFTSPTGSTYGTIVAPTTGTTLTGFGGFQNFDGGLIVPPGGVLALLNTVSTTTMSVASRLLWEEVAI